MANRKTDKTGWQKIRKFFNDVHLWLGLSSGLIVVLVCFSGTVYVFNTELTEMAASHLYTAKPSNSAVRIPPDSLMEKVKESSGGKIISVVIPERSDRNYQFNVRKKGDESRGGIGYMVNPYTGEIVGNTKEENGMKEFMSTMFSLHRWLLLDKIEDPLVDGFTNRELGSKITGWATIIFTLGCITGLVIWIPQKTRNWRQGLKIRFRANWKRVNHDLHNTLAFYALFFLLIMGLTGPQWSFEWYREGLQKSLGTYKPKDAPKEKPLRSKIPADSEFTSLSIQDYLRSANQVLSYTGDVTVVLPSDSAATVAVNKNRTGFFAPAAPDRLNLDQYSGEVVKTEIFRDKPFNERIAGSIKALHIGNVYGMFTKIIYFFACLIATSLPVTGTLFWLNKLKKKKASKGTASPANAADKRFSYNLSEG